MTRIEEKALVANIIRGDSEASRIFLKNFRPLIANLANRFFRNNPADREDAISEAVVRLIETFPRWKGNCALTTWVYRVSANRFLMLIRTAKSRPHSAVPDEEFDELLPSPDVFQETAIIHKYLARDIFEHISPAQVQLLSELFIFGKTYEEMRRARGISITALKTRVHRAKLRAREVAMNL